MCFVCIRGKAKTKAMPQVLKVPQAKTAKPYAKAKAKGKAQAPTSNGKKGKAFIKRPCHHPEQEGDEGGDACCFHRICFCLLVC